MIIKYIYRSLSVRLDWVIWKILCCLYFFCRLTVITTFKENCVTLDAKPVAFCFWKNFVVSVRIITTEQVTSCWDLYKILSCFLTCKEYFLCLLWFENGELYGCVMGGLDIGSQNFSPKSLHECAVDLCTSCTQYVVCSLFVSIHEHRLFYVPFIEWIPWLKWTRS